MAGGDYISPADIDFDDQGRAIISNPAVVKRLRELGSNDTISAAASLELKNVGCCSVTDELRKSAKDFAEVELKNVGCCSVTDELRKSAKDFGELELKNVGCCSVTDELRKSAKDFGEVELKNVGCCSVTAE